MVWHAHLGGATDCGLLFPRNPPLCLVHPLGEFKFTLVHSGLTQAHFFAFVGVHVHLDRHDVYPVLCRLGDRVAGRGRLLALARGCASELARALERPSSGHWGVGSGRGGILAVAICDVERAVAMASVWNQLRARHVP